MDGGSGPSGGSGAPVCAAVARIGPPLGRRRPASPGAVGPLGGVGTEDAVSVHDDMAAESRATLDSGRDDEVLPREVLADPAQVSGGGRGGELA